ISKKRQKGIVVDYKMSIGCSLGREVAFNFSSVSIQAVQMPLRGAQIQVGPADGSRRCHLGSELLFPEQFSSLCIQSISDSIHPTREPERQVGQNSRLKNLEANETDHRKRHEQRGPNHDAR